MLAKVRRWGNGLALRVHTKDLASAGISDGDLVEVELTRVPGLGGLTTKALPTFEDDDPRASQHHDRYRYE